MEQLTGKKLLILGANPETTALVLTAKNMGVYTVVTDYDPDADAKKYADKSYDVDAIDVDKLVEVAKKEAVDGVLVGVADALIKTYQQVCERLALPCYATKEQAAVFTNKDLFKRKCEQYGILGVPEYSHDTLREQIKYPVIVKPTDGNSGKGISLCYNEEELQSAIEKALDASPSKSYLLEEYMECEDVSIYYTIIDGEVYLSSLSDRYTNRNVNKLSPVCLGDIFPSDLIEEFMQKEHPKFCKLFKEIGLQNGIFYTSAFYRDGNYYVYDPGFRLQGGGFHLILNGANGFDHREMLIRHAITGSMGEGDFEQKNDPYLHGKSAAVIWFLLEAGTIAKIEGLDYLNRHASVVHVVQRFYEGENIPESAVGTERQVFLRIFMVCESRQQLCKDVTDFKERIKVYDDLGKEMHISAIDIDSI